jgi:hypothetical protein
VLILPEQNPQRPGRFAVKHAILCFIAATVLGGLTSACVAAPKSTVKISGEYTVQAISSERK